MEQKKFQRIIDLFDALEDGHFCSTSSSPLETATAYKLIKAYLSDDMQKLIPEKIIQQSGVVSQKTGENKKLPFAKRDLNESEEY